MSRPESLTPIMQQLNGLELSDSDTSPPQATTADQSGTRIAPARRSSWLKEVGTDNSRRHSSSFANQPTYGPPHSFSQPSRSQSFSVGQQNTDDPTAAAQKRFSSAFSALSESAIEDEHDLSARSSSSKSGSVIDAPLIAPGVNAEQQIPRSAFPNTSLPHQSIDLNSLNNLGAFPTQISSDIFNDDPEMAPTFYVVQFKLHRADVYMYESSFGLTMSPGDLVMVEADRGIDLGKIVLARVKRTTAQLEVAALQKKHHQELLSFSRQSKVDTSFEAPAMNTFDHVRQEERRGGRQNCRQILRKPRTDEIIKLRDKEGQEAKARRIAHNEAAKLGFNIEILDAEFQFDFEKLTISYYAETYVHFNNLVNSLYKYYKTRIWMSNVCQSATAPNMLVTPSNPPAGMVGVPRPAHMSPRFVPMGNQNLANPSGPPFFDQYGISIPDYPPPTPQGKSLYNWGSRATVPASTFSYASGLGQVPPDPAQIRVQQVREAGNAPQHQQRQQQLVQPQDNYYGGPVVSPRTYDRIMATRNQPLHPQIPHQTQQSPGFIPGQPQQRSPWNLPNSRR